MTDRITEIKKLHGCALVVFDSGDSLKVPLSLFRERKLREGECVNAGIYREYILQRGYAHALDHAVKLLSLCDRSENDVRHRLRDSGYPDAVVDKVIDKLYGAELLDDAAYARNYARERAHRYGRDRVERELVRHGVEREEARCAAEEEMNDEEQLQDAVRLTGKYLARTHGDFDRSLYQRTLAMLARHGYNADIARKALQIIAEGQDETEE